jgi:threonine/homoserine/homoserine lactone efflux protein
MIAFVVGFVIGYLTTIPVGPINIAVIMKALHNRTGQAMMIGTGSAVMDIIYCGAALFGISIIISHPALALAFRIAPFLIFFYYGIRTSFLKLPEPHLTQNPVDTPGFKRFFLLGMAMYFSNPSFIAYWVTIAGIVHGYHLITPTTYDNAMFAVGTGAGVTIWFATLVALIEKHKMRFNPKTIHRTTRFFGLLMLAVSIVLGWNLFSDLLLH